jgi:magnesium chelatase subunit I
VVGGIDERYALERQKVRLQRGILAQADQHILYIDEINLLDDAILDAILDAAAQGTYTLRRGPMKLTYWSRFLLVASMNPEEGSLRPQIMDRFGLRIVVRGLDDADERFTAYQRALSYRQNQAGLATNYAADTLAAAEEVKAAQERLPSVSIGEDARELGTQLVQAWQVDSNRADMTLFEAARAYAAIDERTVVTTEDITMVASMALRMRHSAGLVAFYGALEEEEARMAAKLQQLHPAPRKDDASDPAGPPTLAPSHET